MKLFMAENFQAIFNSDEFAKAEIVYDIMGDDEYSPMGYALDAWTKDGSVYRLGMYKTVEKAISELTMLMWELACSEENIIVHSGRKPEHIVRAEMLK